MKLFISNSTALSRLLKNSCSPLISRRFLLLPACCCFVGLHQSWSHSEYRRTIQPSSAFINLRELAISQLNLSPHHSVSVLDDVQIAGLSQTCWLLFSSTFQPSYLNAFDLDDTYILHGSIISPLQEYCCSFLNIVLFRNEGRLIPLNYLSIRHFILQLGCVGSFLQLPFFFSLLQLLFFRSFHICLNYIEKKGVVHYLPQKNNNFLNILELFFLLLFFLDVTSSCIFQQKFLSEDLTVNWFIC